MLQNLLTPGQIKFRCYCYIAWGIVATFIIIGGLLGKPIATAAAAILAVSWVIVRIIGEMMDAFLILKRLKSTQR